MWHTVALLTLLVASLFSPASAADHHQGQPFIDIIVRPQYPLGEEVEIVAWVQNPTDSDYVWEGRLGCPGQFVVSYAGQIVSRSRTICAGMNVEYRVEPHGRIPVAIGSWTPQFPGVHLVAATTFGELMAERTFFVGAPAAVGGLFLLQLLAGCLVVIAVRVRRPRT